MRIRKTLLASAVTGAVAFGLLAPAVPAGAAVRLETALSGANEVPGPGDSDGSGAATVRVNVKARRVCYAISVRNITLPAVGAQSTAGARALPDRSR